MACRDWGTVQRSRTFANELRESAAYSLVAGVRARLRCVAGEVVVGASRSTLRGSLSRRARGGSLEVEQAAAPRARPLSTWRGNC